jgi:hypothetical protein
MKNIKTIAVVAVLGLAVSGFAIAHSWHGRGHHMLHHLKNATAAVDHLAEVFPRFASFDTNKDGQIDATEKESIAKALAEGTVQLPTHTPPNGAALTPEMILSHVPDMYARIAPYDANHNGAFEVAEQASLKTAIEKGEIHFPHGQHSSDAGARK